VAPVLQLRMGVWSLLVAVQAASQHMFVTKASVLLSDDINSKKNNFTSSMLPLCTTQPKSMRFLIPQSGCESEIFFVDGARKPFYACIWSVVSAVEARILRFERFPLSGKPCRAHGSKEGCWRPRLPLELHTVTISVGCRVGALLCPRVGDVGSGVVEMWSRCFHACSIDLAGPPTSSASFDVSQFVEDAARSLLEGDAHTCVTLAVSTMFDDVTTTRIVPDTPPVNCHHAAGENSAGPQAGACRIVKKGWRVAGSIISADGVRIGLSQRYRCEEHGVNWILPQGPSLVGASVVGDVLGAYVISSDYWPRVLRIFQETENFHALEDDLRASTQEFVSRAVAGHHLRSALSELECQILHSALIRHCVRTPGRRTIKSWLEV
jgi:hypothetical protein